MQPKARKAYVPGLAALLVALVAGCSGGGAADGTVTDTKPGGPTTATTAQPGKYRTLREPCGSVPRSMLKDLLPGAASLPEEQQTKVYQGTASVTYDTDRRVGCSWKATSPDASNQLMIDLERVVSYDPAVSDADRAQEVYTKKETAAGLSPASGTPSGTPSTSGTGTGTDTAPGTTTQTGSPSASGSPSGTPSGTPSDGTTPDGLEPRVLDSLGDAAFLDDVLARPGAAAQQRSVSVVFRTSNVIVTVRYTEQPAHPTVVPDSKELQDKAQGLARTLNEQLNE
ncbi:hypothetical protein [Streptomyces scopuliridis]|uniref:DUF3558 domain-containing protein n=1 Tax=Streptomyces scopuliridis RB72 TaxID=1440053 RepID=A0A2T7SYA5_9ACTN|nr:hypothetical protein [Streptomyces scopuliridis]PVE07865.1 hypothetical protein Y717_21345 [Streptomyces scopuliridis RB72]